MKILLTGSSSGVGKELKNILSTSHELDCPERSELDLNDPTAVMGYITQSYDMLINCAGTGVGGKIDFVNHDCSQVQEILQVNLVSAVILTHQVLKFNPKCKIVNITSTNNNRYWPNDLAYSLSKKSLEIFGSMLLVEYPGVPYLEIRLGLTKTSFNNNRYKHSYDRFHDIYSSAQHLMPETVAKTIVDNIFNNNVKYIEVSP
jgi:short-subunit dehydrogenase